MFNPSFTSILEQANKFTNDLDTKFNSINIRLDNIMATLDAITAQVTANNNLLASAIQLIDGLAAQITAAGTDPAKLAALTSALQAQDHTLAAAILANTPVVVEGSAWSPTQVYEIGDTVLFTDGNTYSSLVADNVDNTPGTPSTFWSVVPVVTVPASAAVKAS